jgi:hypothetical protein
LSSEREEIVEVLGAAALPANASVSVARTRALMLSRSSA